MPKRHSPHTPHTPRSRQILLEQLSGIFHTLLGIAIVAGLLMIGN